MTSAISVPYLAKLMRCDFCSMLLTEQTLNDKNLINFDMLVYEKKNGTIRIYSVCKPSELKLSQTCNLILRTTQRLRIGKFVLPPLLVISHKKSFYLGPSIFEQKKLCVCWPNEPSITNVQISLSIFFLIVHTHLYFWWVCPQQKKENLPQFYENKNYFILYETSQKKIFS